MISNRTILVAYPFAPVLIPSQPRDLHRTALVECAIRDMSSSPIYLRRPLAILRLVLVAWFGPPRGPSDLRSNAPALVRSQPFAQNRTLAASSPSSRRPRAPVPERGAEKAAPRHLVSSLQLGLVALHLMLVVRPPPKSPLPSALPARVTHGGRAPVSIRGGL